MKPRLSYTQLHGWVEHPVTQVMLHMLCKIKQNTYKDIEQLPLTKMSPESLGLVLAQLEARNKTITILEEMVDLDKPEFSILNEYVDWVK